MVIGDDKKYAPALPRLRSAPQFNKWGFLIPYRETIDADSLEQRVGKPDGEQRDGGGAVGKAYRFEDNKFTSRRICNNMPFTLVKFQRIGPKCCREQPWAPRWSTLTSSIVPHRSIGNFCEKLAPTDISRQSLRTSMGRGSMLEDISSY